VLEKQEKRCFHPSFLNPEKKKEKNNRGPEGTELKKEKGEGRARRDQPEHLLRNYSCGRRRKLITSPFSERGGEV